MLPMNFAFPRRCLWDLSGSLISQDYWPNNSDPVARYPGRNSKAQDLTAYPMHAADASTLPHIK